ncbi:peptide deformylase [Bacilli bacterium]|nr:peptide deformylase [Bacilli bacterium]
MKPQQSWILKDDNPLLKKHTALLTFPIDKDDQLLIDHMVSYIDACYEGKAKEHGIRVGIALAGPQVGLMKKVIYIHFNVGKQEYKYLIANPKIVAESMVFGFIKAGEGCLSVERDVPGVVKRRNKIIVQAIDLHTNKSIVINAEGILAICLQHEIDHLNGILYYDNINLNLPLNVDPN